ncbi:unnamed protein product [Urochloa decumbens]|uniref:BED-type domain-containing protein n=1 Tax=Urochloa decumbens TaxID=240449 RepID=A0ABC9GXW7_9POAL
MSSAASNPSSSTTTSKPKSLKRNSDDIGWDYGVLVDPNNLNLIKCKLCGLQVSAGIYRLKLHIAGIRGQVQPCKKSTDEDKERCKKVIDESKQVKKARLTEQQEVRDAVDLDGAPEADDDITMAEVEEINGAGGKTIRKIGPMDKFTLPLDEASLIH